MTNTRIARIALALSIAGLAAACSGDAAGPTAVEPGPGPESGPKFESRWDMAVTVRYVKGSADETCDGKDLLGRVNPGEYQFRIRSARGSDSNGMASRSYGSASGKS